MLLRGAVSSASNPVPRPRPLQLVPHTRQIDPVSLPAPTMQIFLQRMTGKTVTIDASPSDTILLIKEKFQDKEGLAPAQQCLIFAGREVDDDKTLSDYNIHKEDTLNVIEKVLASPLEAVANAASTGEIVAAFARIAAAVAASPPTITIAKTDIIVAYKTWREGHPGECRG